jgi:gliding motility-associated-like protein/uncharacterized repeat protein (TIGR02543 family)
MTIMIFKNIKKMKKIFILSIFVFLGVTQGFAQIFTQNFSSSTATSAYVNATTPSNGQFTFISAFGSSPFVISNGRLLLNKAGSGSAQVVRNVNFSSIPDFAYIKFKFETQAAAGTTTTVNHGAFIVGAGFANDANLPDNTAVGGKAHSKFGFTISDNTFTVNLISNLANTTFSQASAVFTGEQEISFVVNNSGSSKIYVAPNGTFEAVENDTWDLWVGTTKVYNDIAAVGPTIDIANFRFSFSSTISSTNVARLYFDDINIYDQSILPPIVSFESNGGAAVPEIYAVVNQTIVAPIAPTKIGHTFGGWYKEAAFTTPWSFATDIVTAATTLYAKWNPIVYTVSFNSNGGTAVPSAQVNYNSTFSAPTVPTKADVIFGGWYKEATLAIPWDFAADVVTGDMILYAKWNDPRQSITFPAIADKVYGETPFTLTATASSGLPVTYQALTNNITINGSIVTITNTGLATIRATQAGNASYNEAAPVEVSFTVNKAPQTITFNQPKPVSRYAGVVTLTAISSSGLPVSFSANEPSVGVITSDNKLQVKGLGTIKIIASQPGNEFYLPATVIEREVVVHTAGSAQLLVNQALSPNGDGINDSFMVEGIKAYPENQVKIVSRSGALVYEQKGYDNDKVVFVGRSNGGDKLPDGTYYYSIVYKQNGQWVQKKGYLFIKN